MKALLAALVLVVSIAAQAQSLHFVSGGRIPYQGMASSLLGRIVEPRIDVLRSKYDWDCYYSAQNGFFGGPVTTSIVQPDFCQEQVIAINLGGDGTFGKLPFIRTVRSWDDCTWEVVVELCEPEKNPVPTQSMFSPYLAIRTPLGPDNFRFVFVTSEGREVVELSSPRCCLLPKEWWRYHGRNGRSD